MLDSLEIRNFRNLKNLEISALSRINLITGKNNTGKSSILEAIVIFITKADLSTIYSLLEERGERYRETESKKEITDINIKSISSLFTNRVPKDILSIGTIENDIFGEQRSNDKFVSMRFVHYIEDIFKENENDLNYRTKKIIDLDNFDFQFFGQDYKIGLEIRNGKNTVILSLDREQFWRGLSIFKTFDTIENYQLIRTRNIEKEINGRLWDNITLTDKENYVINTLKIIEPDIERLAFIDEGRGERKAMVKIKNENIAVPLKSMGDGINRILTIILAMVNVENGYLLIDEFENGLHYSVQEKLWEIVFHLSEKLNIQVFATTHSKDCISSFEKVLNREGNKLVGKLIRLDIKNNEVKQVEFDFEELKIANNRNIEIR